jgi:hypothetical protein
MAMSSDIPDSAIDADEPRLIVDPDDRRTWPRAVTEWVTERADRLRGTAEDALGLRLPLEEENDFRALFAGTKVRAYHATRLLECEVAMIREQGLRPLTAELVEERIACAFAAGAISDVYRDRLYKSHVFARGSEQQRGLRQNEISLYIGRGALDAFGHPQLSIWGGEAIYMFGPKEEWHLLESLGCPAIVVAAIALSAEVRVRATLGKIFVGLELGLKSAFGGVEKYRPAIAAEDILAIWQPGDPEYERHAGLPPC